MGLSLKQIVSKNVRAIRKAQGLSQQELAAKTKLSVRYVSRIENDPPDVTLHNLERLAKGLGITAAELIEDWGNALPKPSKKGLEAVSFTVRLLQSYLETDT